MSLVNDMLRDLDKQPVPRSSAKRLLNEDISIEPKRDTSFQLSSFLPGFVAFLIVGAAVFFSLEPENANDGVVGALQVEPATDSELTIESEPAPAMEAELEAPAPEDSTQLLKSLLNAAKTDYYQEAVGGLSEPDQTESEQSVEVKPAASIELAPAQALQVKQLLRDARRALNLDRLTSPITDNAFDHYSAVLDIDVMNEEAQTGLNVIAERYVELAQDYALEGNTTRAGVLLRRASAVVPFHAAVVNFWPNINRYGYALAEVEQNNEVPVKTTQAVEPGAGKQAATASAPKKAVDKVERPQEPAQKTVNLVRNAESLDRQMAREARDLVAQGRASSARSHLQAFVVGNPGALHSVRVLFDLLLQVNAYADAKRLLAQSSDLSALELSKMTAYWFLAQDDLQGAGRAIDSQKTNTQVDTSFLALKAGVLHKLARYQESAETYKALLRQDQENPAYWLGLAVASDAMKDAGAALQAFKAAEPGQKNADIRRYIATRISALSQRSLSTTGTLTNP